MRVDLKRRSSEPNLDPKTVAGFGKEWSTYDQTGLQADELDRMFRAYFEIFPFDSLPSGAEGFDLGCGSGRWAELVLQRVGRLHCIDASEEALAVARRRLVGRPCVEFHCSSVDEMPLSESSQDFGYSLGVLHHVPDPVSALSECVGKLKPGAPFLVYLYYDFDNRPVWYQRLWRVTNLGRQFISRLPFQARKTLTTLIAGAVYWPLSRISQLAARGGADVNLWPLSTYRNSSFHTLRTDALDRFGTRLEHRFSRKEIEQMMTAAGLVDVVFSNDAPYWVACGRRRRA